MKVLFMGTPAFAVPSLEMLCQEHEVVAVVTQPDRPKGRGKKLLPPEIKEKAIAYGLPVYQPEKVKEDSFLNLLETLEFDIIVVVAFGQILPERILCMPKYGCINVHGSLLPKYRGAGPIQWAIINGEKQTGVTIMYMAKGLDSGDMILKTPMDILPNDTYGSLSERMSHIGAQALKEALEEIKAGTAKRTAQNHQEATYAPMIDKEIGHLDWSKSSFSISCLVRGLYPQVGAYCFYEEEMLKIWEVQCLEKQFPQAVCGEIVEVNKKGFIVKTGDGSVLIRLIQAKGGKMMPTDAYLRGHEIRVGTILK